MTRYPSFPFDDYRRYLHHLDQLLKQLHAQGTHVAVTLFDPGAYTDYCHGTRQPPDAPGTRARYVAEAGATGPAVRYTRQPLTALRAELAREAARRDTWERATDLLLDAGTCPECGQDTAHCAFDRASHTLLRVVAALGPGTHHVVCSLPVDDAGPSLLAAVLIDAAEPGPGAEPTPGPEAGPAPGPPWNGAAAGQSDDTRTDSAASGRLRFSENDALVLCTVMAAGSVTSRPGGLVVRTTTGQGPRRTETVRGWSLRGGEPHPLSEAEVFSAYCTDPATGEPVPPEPGVRYRAGLPLPSQDDLP